MMCSKSRERQYLLEIVRVRVVPWLESLGFCFCDLPERYLNSSMESVYPLGLAKRVSGDLLDLVEFQFDKNGGSYFFLNFGRVGRSGVVYPWVSLSQDEVLASDLPEYFRLENKLNGDRFGARRCLFVCLVSSDSAIDDFLDRFVFVDRWFKGFDEVEHFKKISHVA